MPKLASSISPLQLRNLLSRYISSSSSSSSSSSIPQLYLNFHKTPIFSTQFSLTKPYFPFPKHFSSAPLAQNDDELAKSLSNELLKDQKLESLSLSQRLDLSYSHVTPSFTLIKSVLNSVPDAGRNVLGFRDWVLKNPNFVPDDDTFASFIDYFGRRKDFKAFDDVLGSGREVIGVKTMNAYVNRLVRAGRPMQAVSFFEKMEVDFGFTRDIESLRFVVEKLCEHGHGSIAEKMVKSLAGEFFPDEHICDMLIKGWCVDGKLDEARRLAEEMRSGGFGLGTNAYNDILDCVCKLCRLKDPFRLLPEAEKVLIEMDIAGVPRNVETFNVLINNLCKIRKTEDAVKLFHRMGEWGCYPDATTFLTLTRSLYQAARVSEGDEMIDRMKSAGFGDALTKKEFYGFIKILCGIERLDHAMSVFAKMKGHGCKPGVPTYDLLMGRLGAYGRIDRANALFREATRNGVKVVPKEYQIDPSFAKKKIKPVKQEKKRETLPEKTARKRTRLRKLRLSYVKKPKKSMRRAY